MERVSYTNVINSMMYTIVYCRPNIAHIVSSINRYTANHSKEHWKALKWILQYLQEIGGLVYFLGNKMDFRRTPCKIKYGAPKPWKIK